MFAASDPSVALAKEEAKVAQREPDGARQLTKYGLKSIRSL